MEQRAANQKLQEWQRKFQHNKTEYEDQLARMNDREDLYKGTDKLKPLTGKDKAPDGGGHQTPHVRNIIAENIESQVNSAIPQPKVTARRKKDEPKAKLIEDMIRNELNRMPFEYLNDMQERTVPLQGGSFYHLEWDNNQRTHTTVGELAVSARHPKQVIPQEGVYTGIEDMDYIFLELPTTKQAVKRRYNVDVSDETEESPEVRGGDDESPATDMVTQVIALYRNDKGGIGLYSWVRDTELVDMEDYQARRLPRCKACGELQPMEGTEIVESVAMALPDAMSAGIGALPETAAKIRVWHQGDPCPHCGGRKWESEEEEFQEIWDPIVRGGKVIVPGQARHRVDPNDGEVWYVDNLQDISMMQVKDFTGNLEYEMGYMAQVYEEARQAIGITDSFQGRTDTSAKSGVAKQFAAAQSAGRMESKRVMKDAAYADIFRLIFLFQLAYADEPRPVVSQDSKGNKVYREFSKWDFLEKDEAGEYYWNTDFLFATDTSAPLANNRERMWEDTINLFNAGCFGNPGELETLIALWTKLELLHYPGAGDTRGYLEEKLEQQIREAQMQAQQQAMQQRLAAQQTQMGQNHAGAVGPAQAAPEQLLSAIDHQAKADAMQTVFGGQ